MLAQMMEIEGVVEDDFEERLFKIEEEIFVKIREQNKQIKIARKISKEEAIQKIAEILYIRDMEFDGWKEKDILPFKELKGEFKDNFLKLAKNLYKVAIND